MAAGWQNDGTFVRANPDFQGNDVWQQDQQVPFKVIASRHDIHDNVLADGIAACLNLDGVNQMRASLKMGGYKITNIADGSNSGDAASFDQIITAAAFDNGSRNLTLTRANGDFVVNIPDSGGGGGGGTVTQVLAGIGLDVSPANANATSYTLSLEPIGTGQTISGGIESITYDNYGRVTQVVQGTQGVTNLGFNPAANQFGITSDTGTNATVLGATQTLAGAMTASDKAALDALVALNTPSISEGTWTPTLARDSSGAEWEFGTYGIQSGRYQRIGNMVYVTGTLEVNANSTNGTTPMALGGLPFNVSDMDNASIEVGATAYMVVGGGESWSLGCTATGNNRKWMKITRQYMGSNEFDYQTAVAMAPQQFSPNGGRAMMRFSGIYYTTDP